MKLQFRYFKFLFFFRTYHNKTKTADRTRLFSLNETEGLGIIEYKRVNAIVKGIISKEDKISCHTTCLIVVIDLDSVA